MWIILFNGVPSFWLVGDTTYRVGKRDCDVNIEDDKSISRHHLLFAVGLTPSQHIDAALASAEEAALSSTTPAPITLTDSSTYGTVVYPCGKNHETDEERHEAQRRAQPDPALALSASEVGLGGGIAARASRRAGQTQTQTDDMTPPADWGPTGETHRLVKNVPFDIAHTDDPRWRAFTVVLGNHGAALVFVWVPVHVLVEDVEPDAHTKLEQALNRCGAFILHEKAVEDKSAALLDVDSGGRSSMEIAADRRRSLYQRADLLVTTAVQPSPAVVALLCRGVPIVTPTFFMEVRDRATAQIPLPDVNRYTPPLAGTFWEQLTDRVLHDEGGRREKDGPMRASQVTRMTTTLMLPHPRRQTLLHGLVFVVFQAPLYEEVSQYIPCAGGAVQLDQTLSGVVNARTTQTVLASFFSAHRGHVVLYSQTERMPFRGCLEALRDELKLSCLEYADLVVSLFRVRTPTLDAFPSSSWPTTAHESEPDPQKLNGSAPSAPASARPSGRRTDAQPLFPELYGRASHADHNPGTVHDPRRRVSRDGWVSRDDATPTTAHVTHKRGRDEEDISEEAELGLVHLPPYPCFRPYTDRHAHDKAATVNGKTFRKQLLPPPEPLVELAERHGASLGAQLLTSRVPAVDSDDLIADRSVPVRGSVGAAFNAFDKAAQNSINKKKGTVRRGARTRATARAPAADQDAMGVEDVQDIQLGRAVPAPSPPPPTNTTPPPPPNPVFSVFDIEGIY